MGSERKTILITGSTAGIGRATATELAGTGAKLVLAARSREKADALVAELAEAGNADAEVVIGDLFSQGDIRRMAAEILAAHDRIDVLINNAGALFTSREETVDGIERTWALNHLSYFLLTQLLLDAVKAAPNGRIVNVSSDAHYEGQMNWGDPGFAKSWPAQGWAVYCHSKLANVLFTKELARRLDGTGVTANCLHPGFVASSFARNNGFLGKLVMTVSRPFQRNVGKGAETVVYLATSPAVEGVTGKYFFDCAEKKPSRAAREEDAPARLWAISEEQVAVG